MVNENQLMFGNLLSCTKYNEIFSILLCFLKIIVSTNKPT